MKASEAYRGVFVSVARWPAVPTEMVITEAGIEDDPFSKKKDGLLIFVQFDNGEEKYRVNRTNSAVLIKAWGDELETWIGKTVTIQRVRTNRDGQLEWSGIITPVEGKPAKSKGKAKS